MKEPTLKKALEPYFTGLDKDINYDPHSNGISALFLAVLYSTQAGVFSPTEEDRLYAKKVVEILLDYGADPTRHEGGNPKHATPLTLAKDMSEANRDPLNIYNLLLKNSLNSASEGVAFEGGKLDNLVKKLKGGQEKITDALKKGLGRFIKNKGVIGETIAKQVIDKQNSERLKAAKDKVTNDLLDDPSSHKKLDDLPEEAKKVILSNELDDLKMSSDPKTDRALRDKLIQLLVKSDNIESSPLLKLVKEVSNHLSSLPPDGKIWSILMNPKYSGLQNVLSNLKGLSKNPAEFVDQISFIAYYLTVKPKDLSRLKVDGSNTWKDLNSMKEMHKPVEDKLTGREIVIKTLGVKGPGLTKSEGIKYLASVLFKGDTVAAGKFLDDNEDEITKILNRSFTKTFHGDNLSNKLNKSLFDLKNSSEDKSSNTDSSLTGREIIINSIGKNSSTLSKNEGVKFISDLLFKGDVNKASEFFENNRKSISQMLDRKYNKTFEDDDPLDLFTRDLKDLLSKSSEGSPKKNNQLTPEQTEAASALQAFGYSKKDSVKMVKGREGSSAEIVVEALKGVDLGSKVKSGKGGKK